MLLSTVLGNDLQPRNVITDVVYKRENVEQKSDPRYQFIPWLLKKFFASSSPNLAAVFRSSNACLWLPRL